MRIVHYSERFVFLFLILLALKRTVCPGSGASVYVMYLEFLLTNQQQLPILPQSLGNEFNTDKGSFRDQVTNFLFVNMDTFPVLQGGMAPEHGDTCDPLEAIR